MPVMKIDTNRTRNKYFFLKKKFVFLINRQHEFRFSLSRKRAEPPYG